MKPELSVIVVTHNRAAILKRSLESMCTVDLRPINVEFIIADNDSTDNTRQVVDSFSERLPIKYCFEPRRGQNAARNRTLGLAQGELFIFTDDDVLVAGDWLAEWVSGVSRWPAYHVFGGPIRPEWPGTVPEYVSTMPNRDGAYAILEPLQQEGPFRAGLPFGPNMAVRSRVFKKEGFRFNENIGPMEGQYIMGSETELLKRLVAAGHIPIFLPRISVRHIIRPEQLTPKWLYGRSYRYGRSLQYGARGEIIKQFYGLPRYLLPILLTVALKRCRCLLTGDRIGFIREGMKYWTIRGQLRQAWLDRDVDHQDQD